MLWTLLSIVVAFAELIAFMSADWLIGKAKTRGGADPEERAGPSEPHHPTLGIYARCIRNPGVQHVPRETLCGPYAENFGEIASGFWQATAIFLAVGIFILCMVALVSVFTMCVQSIMKKSIFNVCGLLQGIAGKRARRVGAWEREGLCVHGAHTCVLTAVLKTLFCLVRLILQKSVLSTIGALPQSLPSPRSTLLFGGSVFSALMFLFIAISSGSKLLDFVEETTTTLLFPLKACFLHSASAEE